jgi:hypothetical protein
MSDVDVQLSSQESPVNQDQEVEQMAKSKTKRKRTPREIPVVGQEPPVKKAAAVREYLVDHPDAKNAEVIVALAAKGIEVTTNYVSVLRSKKRPKGRPKGGRRRQAAGGLKDVLKQEKAALLKRMEAIDTLLG